MAADRFCRWAIELVLLAMCLAAPWALGGTLPEAVLGLQIGTALVLALWAARAFLTGTLPWRGDLPLAALGGLTLLAALQLVPIPAGALRVLSPATVRTNEFLRPEVGETLPGEGPGAARPAAFPVSLSPPDTRDFFTRLFALTLLYAAARSNLAGPGPLARLAWACAANGALLCLLGIAQRLSSPPNVIYWTLPTENTVFGPFVNRNHLPFYANVCLGLGCALLAGRLRDGPAEVLARPSALWLVVLVGVTATGIAFSQSRGGVVAGLAAGAACLLVWFRNARRAGGVGWLPWAALAVVAVGSWLGWGPLTARLGTLDADRAAEEGRVEMWAASLGLAANYPVLGTGAGTYDWVEPGTRTRPGLEEWSAEHAHNEYVEGAVEGGAVRLGLTLLLVVAPVVRVVRRHRETTGRPGAELLLGGLYGFLAVALHSVTDFGVHLPAIAVLAAVHLAALMAAADREEPPGALRPAPAAWLAGLGLAAAGALVVWDGWTADRAERARAATAGLAADRPLTAAQAERAVRLLAAACEARPGNALYRHELGQAHLARALTRPPDSADRPVDLRAALGHWRAARDLSAVMAPTHARLGRYRDLFATADPALVYFERARRLLPTDATMLFHCGEARWEGGDVAGACADWRASLSGADRHLPEVLARARGRLGPAEVLRDVLPADRPATVLKAADVLFPAGGAEHPDRRAYLEAARDQLAARPAKSAAEWELEARLEAGLGVPDRAAAAYRRALGLAPRQVGWRVAYAEVLRQSGALKDATRELETAVAQDPNNRPARDQLELVRRELRLQAPAAPAEAPRPVREAGVAATVRVSDPAAGSVGTGVVIGARGGYVYVLTAAHVLGPDARPRVEVFGPRGEAPPDEWEVVFRAAEPDLAVVRATAGTREWPAARLAPPPAAGADPPAAWSVGCDDGKDPRVEAVALTRQKLVRRRDRKDGGEALFWEAKGEGVAGRSGGPLLDADGRLIGVCSGTQEGKSYYAHPNEIRAALRDHRLTRPFVGAGK